MHGRERLCVVPKQSWGDTWAVTCSVVSPCCGESLRPMGVIRVPWAQSSSCRGEFGFLGACPHAVG